MLSAVLVGCGSIGADKPDELDSPETENVLTHAHALYNLHKEGKINWIGLVDSDLDKRIEMSKKWNTRNLIRIESIYADIDIFIVAIPTEFHFDMMVQLINRKPKIIICEKPFCSNSYQAENIKKYAKTNNVKIIVNYTRRFVPIYEQLFHELQQSEIQFVKLTYGRGMVREASHFIDFCNRMLGEFYWGHRLGNELKLQLNHNDPSYAAYLVYKKCEHVFLCPADAKHFSIFEIEILTDRGKLILCGPGASQLHRYRVEPQEGVYGKYPAIDSFPDICDFLPEMTNALPALYDSILNDNLTISTDKEAIAVHRVYDRLLNNNE